MKKIFISYRRNDSAVFTGRLFDRLTEYYGADSIFLDIDSIPGAADFRDVVHSHITKCGVFLAVMGKNSSGPRESGRRIDEPDDHVRIEVEQAFAEKKPVIPVYCDDSEPVKPSDLPQSLQPLAYANACPVDPGRDFHQHVIRLRREINRILLPSKWTLSVHVLLRFVRRNRMGIGLWLVFALIVLLLRDPIGRLLMTRHGMDYAVETADPDTFSRGEGHTYQIARAMPDRKSLVSETDIVNTIRQTNETFDAFTLTGSVFFNNSEALRDCLQRGVRFRILLLDHSELNRTHVESYFVHCGGNGTGFEWSVDNAKLAHATFVHLNQEATNKGSIEVRWWKGPFLNAFWVRDSKLPTTALAHAEISYFGDAANNPSVRFGKLSPKLIGSLHEQFEYMWAKSAK